MAPARTLRSARILSEDSYKIVTQSTICLVLRPGPWPRRAAGLVQFLRPALAAEEVQGQALELARMRQVRLGDGAGQAAVAPALEHAGMDVGSATHRRRVAQLLRYFLHRRVL